jgi:hypothetical protein
MRAAGCSGELCGEEVGSVTLMVFGTIIVLVTRKKISSRKMTSVIEAIL